MSTAQQEKIAATEEIKQRLSLALGAVREALHTHHLYYTDVVRLRTALDESRDYQERMEIIGLIRIHDQLTDLRDLYQGLR